MSLELAIFAALLTPGGHQVAACRPRCAEHAAELAHAIEGASLATGIDPWLLVAMSYHESSLLGRSNATSAGYFGWHRRGKMWRACAAPCGIDAQADVSARELVRLERACGSTAGALSAWQSGACATAKGERYARRVLRIRESLCAMGGAGDGVRAPQDAAPGQRNGVPSAVRLEAPSACEIPPPRAGAASTTGAL